MSGRLRSVNMPAGRSVRDAFAIPPSSPKKPLWRRFIRPILILCVLLGIITGLAFGVKLLREASEEPVPVASETFAVSVRRGIISDLNGDPRPLTTVLSLLTEATHEDGKMRFILPYSPQIQYRIAQIYSQSRDHVQLAGLTPGTLFRSPYSANVFFIVYRKSSWSNEHRNMVAHIYPDDSYGAKPETRGTKPSMQLWFGDDAMIAISEYSVRFEDEWNINTNWIHVDAGTALVRVGANALPYDPHDQHALRGTQVDIVGATFLASGETAVLVRDEGAVK